MRTIRYIIILSLVIYSVSILLYETNLKTTEKDFQIGIPEPPPPMAVDTTLLLKPDTSPYKGNWVDVE